MDPASNRIWSACDLYVDCYFCGVSIAGFSEKIKHKIVLDSTCKPVNHDNTLPAPIPRGNTLEFVEGDSVSNEGVVTDVQGLSSTPDYASCG